MTDQVTGSISSREASTQPIKHVVGPLKDPFPTSPPKYTYPARCVHLVQLAHTVPWNGNSSPISKCTYPSFSFHPQRQHVTPGAPPLIACAVWVSHGDMHTSKGLRVHPLPKTEVHSSSKRRAEGQKGIAMSQPGSRLKKKEKRKKKAHITS